MGDKQKLWRDISTAPKDGTKIIAWLLPNEIDAPEKAKPRIVSWQMKQWKDATGKKVGEPFGMWESEESCGPMSYALETRIRNLDREIELAAASA